MSGPDAERIGWLTAHVRRALGIDIETLPPDMIAAKLGPIATGAGASSHWELIDILRRGAPRALDEAAVEALANHETTFFRDPWFYEALASDVLPAIIERRRPERRISIWSAACSFGQEPYSLAMLIAHRFPELESWDVRILASDASGHALERARSARYARAEVNRGLPAPMLVRYFEKDGEEWRLSPDIVRRVELRRINLAGTLAAVPVMDLVLIRNVLIYFGPDLKQSVLTRVRERLGDSGVLALGATETTTTIDARFDIVRVGRATIYRPI